MKTEVEMKRLLFGTEITQKSKSALFSATDLVRAGNKWRYRNELTPFSMSLYFKNKSTKEFMNELEKEFGQIIIHGKGRNAQTWVHPLLFIDIALAISPNLKIKVYKWIQDNLIRFRNSSGDSYKEMCGALYTRCSNVREFPKVISNVAEKIREACGVDDWQKATEKQLEKRDRIHILIKAYSKVLQRIDIIVNLSIEESK